MAWKTIEKPQANWTVAPNLRDYEQARASFSWKEAQGRLSGLPEGKGLNIAYEAVDRHAEGPRRDHVALRWIDKRHEVRDLTYTNLQRQTNRFANVLKKLGVGK